MFGKIVDYRVVGQKVIITFEEKEVTLHIVTDKIWRVFSVFQEEDFVSNAIEGEKEKEVAIVCSFESQCLVVSSNTVTAKVYDGGFIDFYNQDGTLVCSDYRGARKTYEGVSEEFIKLALQEGHQIEQKGKDYTIQVLKKIEGDECFYGLGDKTGFLNKRGYEYEMWNTDNPDPQVDSFKALYKSIPFYMALRANCTYGIFYDNAYRTYFDMGKESDEYVVLGANKGNLNYYYIAGESLKEVVTGYTYLTGRTPLPQLWTLGYQQSRWGYESEEEVREIAKKLRENDLPCDVIHLDIDYMEQFKVFTWNKDRYNNPKAFVNELKQDGFKIVTIIDPGVKVEEGYSIYEEGIKNGYFALDKNGEVYVNSVWPGKSVFPDFGKEDTAKWWGEQHKFLLDMGVRGIWNDMNEPASFEGQLPDDVIMHDGHKESTHEKVHNLYGHLMAKATYEGLKKYDKRRPFVITRACYAGSQKYTTAWTGDNHSIWAHLKMAVQQLCNLSLSGMSFVGTDVGGFASDATKELLCRWVQLGCFSPLFRNHSAKGSRYQEPWQFDQETIDINRKYIKLRYQLIPYFYDMFYKMQTDGLPVLRPLVLEFPNDPQVQNMNEQFMVGESLLVAPVLDQGMTKKIVYLPEGTWYDYWTKEEVIGGQYLLRDAALDVCPIYVKAGSSIPNYTDQKYIGEKVQDSLILDLYKGKGSYMHYVDNGEDFSYQSGQYNCYEITLDQSEISIKPIHLGYTNHYKSVILKGNGFTKEVITTLEEEVKISIA